MFLELMNSAAKGELMLWENGFCRFHLGSKGKRAGILVIYEIISLQRGRGSAMLGALKDRVRRDNLVSIQARCPAPYTSNAWWARQGFTRIDRLIPIDDDDTLVINVWEWKNDNGTTQGTTLAQGTS